MHRLPNSMTRFTANCRGGYRSALRFRYDDGTDSTQCCVRAGADIEDNWCIRFEPIIRPVDAGGHAEMHT